MINFFISQLKYNLIYSKAYQLLNILRDETSSVYFISKVKRTNFFHIIHGSRHGQNYFEIVHNALLNWQLFFSYKNLLFFLLLLKTKSVFTCKFIFNFIFYTDNDFGKFFKTVTYFKWNFLYFILLKYK